MHRIPTRSRLVLSTLCLALVAAGCGTSDDTNSATDTAAPSGDEDQLQIAIASFDIAVGDDQRLLAGIFNSEREILAFGDVTYQLGFLGDAASGETELTQTAEASFLGIPGAEPDGSGDAPRFLSGDPGSGVYSGRVDFDEAGFWGLRVVAETGDGEVLEGSTTFAVAEEESVPGVGDPAPRSENHTVTDVESGEVEAVALDSRAGGEDGEIPDPGLHEDVVAEVLDEGRPLVVAIMTPVYCVSRFCGPLANVLADVAEEHDGSVAFVHLEVWEDYDEQLVNEAAADWILPEEGADGNEPWVFLVDGSGTITHRWDNVLDVAELEAALGSL